MGLQVLDTRILVSISFTTDLTSVAFFLKLHRGVAAPVVRRKAMFVPESYTTLLTFIGFFPCV
jgi:hypothetical protein